MTHLPCLARAPGVPPYPQWPLRHWSRRDATACIRPGRERVDVRRLKFTDGSSDKFSLLNADGVVSCLANDAREEANLLRVN